MMFIKLKCFLDKYNNVYQNVSFVMGGLLQINWSLCRPEGLGTWQDWYQNLSSLLRWGFARKYFLSQGVVDTAVPEEIRFEDEFEQFFDCE